MFSKILIANRGEIACRIIATAKRLGVGCVAVYSDADRHAMHVAAADEAHYIGPSVASESYLKVDALINAALDHGCQAIHPGYGFVSENPAMVEACVAAGLVFIGPSASAIRAMGLKDAAKRLMVEADVPVVPGYHGEAQDDALLSQHASEIGYPVLIKARAGGGGKGMRRVESPDLFAQALASARREAKASFSDDHVLIEKFVASPRHIEVQVFADQHGNAVHLFERDCSLQRRHQKVIEEAPAPGMTPALREAMGDAAVRAARAVNYEGAGTVEFIVDASDGLREDRFYFMEMNTRLQVEHPVTEAITGLDLVEWQLRVASGEPLQVAQDALRINGHAFEARIYAEDASQQFRPATGRLHQMHLPHDIARVDTGVQRGDEVTPFYDPMIAKVIVHGSDRDSALTLLEHALAQTRISGCITNVAFLSELVRDDTFRAAQHDTGLIDANLDALLQARQSAPIDHAVAALIALQLDIPPASLDPWDTLRGWRQFETAVQRVTLVLGDTTMQIDVSMPGNGLFHAQCSIDDDTQTVSFAARARGDGTIEVELEGQLRHWVIARSPVGISVYSPISGELHYSQPDPLQDADHGTGNDAQLNSPLPGKVAAVNVNVGDRVSLGDALIVIEAMKMENTLSAARDGIVEQVLVAVNDQVEEGTLVLTLVPEQDESDDS